MNECRFDKFSELDEKSRATVIRQCLPKEQISLYLAWSSATLPTNHDYADEIAETGAALLPYLLPKMEEQSHIGDELNKPKLLIVLDIMQQAGYYKVVNDSLLMNRVESAVDAMQDASLKNWALEIVADIKQG